MPDPNVTSGIGNWSCRSPPRNAPSPSSVAERLTYPTSAIPLQVEITWKSGLEPSASFAFCAGDTDVMYEVRSPAADAVAGTTSSSAAMMASAVPWRLLRADLRTSPVTVLRMACPAQTGTRLDGRPSDRRGWRPSWRRSGVAS